MNRLFISGVLALGLASIAQQPPDPAGLGIASPLIQVERLTGDQYVGFKQSCLLVYADGRYHRETRQQEAADGRPKGNWESAEVFEGNIRAAGLQQLKEIIESEDFRTIKGTLGDPSALRSNLNFGPLGVTPRSDIRVLEASVGHSSRPQIFEVFLGNTHLRYSLKSFITWIDKVEKQKERRLRQTSANNCALSTSSGAGFAWRPTTSLFPTPISMPDPDYPIDQQDARHTGTVVLQVMINADGSVGKVSVKRGIGSMLDAKALEAVKKWIFAPARLEGVTIAAPVTVEVAFR